MLAQAEVFAGLLIQLIIWSVFGVACAMIASSKGRSGVGWFFIGLIFPCIGLIIILTLPNLKEEQARHERLQRENRRLRERQRKDRQVADRRQSQTQQRLGLHDQALNIDSSRQLESESPELLSQGGGSQRPPPFKRPPQKSETKRWFYSADDYSDEQGPLSDRQIIHLFKSNQINLDTAIWRDPWPEWRTLRDVPWLRSKLDE